MARQRLLDGLHAAGFTDINASHLERRSDPDDHRSKRIALTSRGERARAVIRDSIADLEREWSTALGAQRFAQLKGLLAELGALVT